MTRMMMKIMFWGFNTLSSFHVTCCAWNTKKCFPGPFPTMSGQSGTNIYHVYFGTVMDENVAGNLSFSRQPGISYMKVRGFTKSDEKWYRNRSVHVWNVVLSEKSDYCRDRVEPGKTGPDHQEAPSRGASGSFGPVSAGPSLVGFFGPFLSFSTWRHSCTGPGNVEKKNYAFRPVPDRQSKAPDDSGAKKFFFFFLTQKWRGAGALEFQTWHSRPITLRWPFTNFRGYPGNPAPNRWCDPFSVEGPACVDFWTRYVVLGPSQKVRKFHADADTRRLGTPLFLFHI